MVLAMRNMYQTPVGRLMIGSGAHKALLDLTRREGRYMNSPASVKVPPPLPQSVCLSVHLPVCLSVVLLALLCLPVCVCLSVCLSVGLPALLSLCLSWRGQSIRLSVYLSLPLCLCLSFRASVCLSTRLSACLSVYTSVCLPVYVASVLGLGYILIGIYPYCCSTVDVHTLKDNGMHKLQLTLHALILKWPSGARSAPNVLEA